VRFLGSLIKNFIYLCLILIAAGTALFYFDTGSWLVQPIAERAGNFFLAPLKLDIENINGSVREGFSVEKLKLISGDEDLFTLDYASVSPDWDLILSGGMPFVKKINIAGVSSDLDKVTRLVNHFAVSEDKDKEKTDFNLALNPFNLEIKDVNFGTPYANLALGELNLNDDGKLFLDSKIISGENIFPVNINALVNFNNLEILSSDLSLGQASGNFAIAAEPLKANLNLSGLSLDELLKFAPEEIRKEIKISGVIDTNILAEADGDLIKLAGFLASPQGKLNLNASADISSMKILAKGNLQDISLTEIGKIFAPELNLQAEKINLDFDVDTNLDGDILANTRADVKADAPLISAMGTKFLENLSAKIKLEKNQAPELNIIGKIFGGELNSKISGLIDSKISAKGNLKNISLTEIGKIFAPELNLRGEKLNLDFDVDTNLDGDILANTRADVKADMPLISAMGMKILENLSAKIKLEKNQAPKLDVTGRIFGGKLFARGQVDKNFKPEAIVSLVNVDVPTLIKVLPDAAKSIKNPSGKITLRSIISSNLDVNTTLTSEKLAANNIALTNIKAVANYNFNKNTADLEFLNANLGKSLIAASGGANLNTGVFSSILKAENLDPRAIPDLKKLNLTGIYDLNANASGNYNNLASIKANAIFNAKDAGYDKMKFGNLNFPVSFMNNILNISDAKASLPGGVLTLGGSVNLKNIENPYFDLAASTNGINLTQTLKALNLQDKNMPVSGKISGAADIKGNLKNPVFHAALRAENVKAGKLIDMPSAVISAKGDANKIMIDRLEAKLNHSDIKGSGHVTFNKKNFMNSTVNIIAKLKHLNIKKTLAAFMEQPPVDGVIDAEASLTGNLTKLQGGLKITRPIFYGNNEIRDIAVKLNSPEDNHYKINAKARLENFKPEVDIDVKQKDGIFTYNINTKPLDINSAIETQIPSMAGMAKGFASINITGSTKENTNININASAKEIKIMDKISIKNIFMPVLFSQAENKIKMKNGTATLSDGVINSNFEADLTKKLYSGKVNVSYLDFGKLAGEFLTEGEVIGKVNAQANIKGNFGVMPASYANGKFSTTSGYIHKMSIIDKVTPTKKISFEKISGSFFWNGKDLFLNPGTRAVAGSDEPLYRYVHVNGSLGVPGKGLNLLCDGRFDLKILDQLLGAMKGLFQYMTGNLAQNFLRDAAGRIFGVKRKDFQNVSFRLANSWEELRLLDLKITKPIEDFLPIDMLNKDEEKQRDDTQFKLNLKIPVGKGHSSIEEESTGDQFKQQLIDNLFNIGF